MSLPPFVRAVSTIDRAIGTAVTSYLVLRDELVHAYTREERREAISLELYSRNPDFSEGGARFEAGLFDWEARAFAHPRWPRAGRVLVAGAGGGREVRALIERGYSVVAFDPCRAYADALDAVVGSRAGSSAHHASLRDLSRAARGEGVLAAACASGFDAVVLGWGCISHVPDPTDRDAVVAALTVIAPAAPVLVSFAIPPAHVNASATRDRTRRLLRRAFRVLGSPTIAKDGEYFHPNAGFVVKLGRNELDRWSKHGYTVVARGEEPCVHALFAR